MKFISKKKASLIYVILLVAVIFALVFVVAGFLFPEKANITPADLNTKKETIKNSEAFPTTGTITIIPTSTSMSPIEVIGKFRILYGDPFNGSEEKKARYKYSVSDESGNTYNIKIDEHTKLIGVNSVNQFNRKTVKIKGKLFETNTILAESIE